MQINLILRKPYFHQTNNIPLLKKKQNGQLWAIMVNQQNFYPELILITLFATVKTRFIFPIIFISFFTALIEKLANYPTSASVKTLPRCKTCTSELKLPHPHRFQEARWDDPNIGHFNIVHFLKPRTQLPTTDFTKNYNRYQL